MRKHIGKRKEKGIKNQPKRAKTTERSVINIKPVPVKTGQINRKG